ncbi:hypothetical protein, variant [Saprolegnia diclina VS20]|uniref:Uncharacterized protein n=1 Tax=Saprolegnia diclina (strain VS20) TaxID=1156394 RepID=T0QY27_SAPDV|nr:hypothetical protein, variant [Saprolegnia diclina VS20]EQC38940.1 hypothetical protein, variant [Saprolegnia diclina VS20]|eukprot:XP_008607764.1 hypothetical protein, variant [Saprolegnia diclina VS20]
MHGARPRAWIRSIIIEPGLSPAYVAPSAHHGTSVVQGVPSTSSMDISASLHSHVHSTLNLSLDDLSMAELIPPERPALMNLSMNDEDERCDAVADAPPSRLLSSRPHPNPSCSISSFSSHAEMSDAPHMAPPRRAHATHKQAKPSPAVKAAPIGKPKIATKPRRQPPPAKRPPSPQRTKPKTTSSLPQRDRLSQAFLQRPSPPSSPPRRTAATYRLDRNNLCCLQQLFLV